MNKPIYLDYNATTPADPRVWEAILPYISNIFGNAASKTHLYGEEAEKAVGRARQQVADLIHADAKKIIFTTGATEAVNIVLKGVFESFQHKSNHIITVQTEHKAVLDTCAYLESKGASVTYLPVGQDGLIDLRDLEKAITNQTLLVAVMYANNETGVIQPIQEAAKIAHDKGAFFMTDATQAVGKIPVDVQTDDVDFMAFSAHKLYGLKGAGVLFLKNIKNSNLIPLIHGGGHEKGLRSGTLNVPAIVGFGKACKICTEQIEDDILRISNLRDQLEKELLALKDTFLNGPTYNRLPNTTNICFKGVEADEFILRTKQKLAVATGSACTSATIEPSHVLKAMGLSSELAHASVRFSLGRFTKEQEIKEAICVVKEAVNSIRQLHKVSAHE